MALVTIQRSPTPSTDPDLDIVDSSEDTSDGRSQLRKSLSESYFTVKGAALILPHTECTRKTTKKSHGGEIQCHLQAMLHLLRPEDSIKIAVRLEDTANQYQCYMALVSTRGRQDTEEAVILGIDCTNTAATIGLVLPIWMGLTIKLGGDGGFSLCVDERSHLFKPVSVQAMWSAIQSLYKVLRIAEDMKYIPDGLTHTWVGYYRCRIDSRDSVRMSQWNVEGVEVFAPSSFSIKANDSESERLKLTISQTLKEVMMTFDLDEATSVMLRKAAEQKMGVSLTAYKSYFDEEVMRIVGQMDKASKILDFLYLGSEWNASNLDELIENGIGYILNVTREIDNFFEGRFEYSNVRVYDEDEADLLKYWDNTYKFISKARSHDSKVLVHCKMGVSRSASTVMAFLMKDQRMTVDDAYKYVKERRNCVHPNSGFMEQLRTYEGILTASNKRDIFRNKSEQNLLDEYSQDDVEDCFLGDSLFHMMSHTDWQSISDSLNCHNDFLGSLHKDHIHSSDILPVNTELEAAESRSADSTKEFISDASCQVPDFIIALNAPSSSTTSAPVPITRQPVGDTSSIRESLQYQESVADLESSAAVSYSECSSSIQLRISLGAVGPRIKPDSSWIKMDTIELENCDCSESLPVNETLPSDNICNSGQTLAADFDSPKSTTISRFDIARSKHVFDGESSLGTETHEFQPLSSSSNLYSCSHSPEKFETGSYSSGVQFFLGNSQIPLDTSIDQPVTAVQCSNTHSTSPVITKYSLPNQRKSSDVTSLSNDLSTSAQNIDAKQAAVESLVQNILQKESLNKQSKCTNIALEKAEESVTVEEANLSNIDSSQSPHNRIEPGVCQYFYREKIPWKPGKVKKMQEDINKTGQISQDEDEDNKYMEKDAKECYAHQDLSDEWVLLEKTSVYQPAISLCQSHSCVELSISEDSDSAPISLYMKEDIPLTTGTVLRTRLEIEERQRVLYGNGDQELFGSSHPVIRTSSLKQDRSSPRSRYTDNRRMTCVPIMSPAKSLDEAHFVGCEYLLSMKSPTSLTPSQLKNSDEELSDRVKERPIEAGLVRKHKMELEIKSELERTNPRTSLRSSSPINIKTHSTLCITQSSSDNLRNSLAAKNRMSSENLQYGCQSFMSESLTHSADKSLFHSDSAIHDAGMLMNPCSSECVDTPSPNTVKYFVRKIEKEAVMSTSCGHNLPICEVETMKDISPIKDKFINMNSSSADDRLSHGDSHALNTSTFTKTSSELHPFCATVAPSVMSSDCRVTAEDALLEVIKDATFVSGFTKKRSESIESGSFFSSRASLDLKLDVPIHIPDVTNQVTEDSKSLCHSITGTRVKNQVASMVDTSKNDLATNPRIPSHIVNHESPEACMVKHLVERFENKSPDLDIVSTNSSVELILKLKDLRDISISSPTLSPNTQMRQQCNLQSCLEDASALTTATVPYSHLKTIDNVITHSVDNIGAHSSSLSSNFPLSSSSSTLVASSSSTTTSSTLVPFHRQHQSQEDIVHSKVFTSGNVPFMSDIAIELYELPSDKNSLKTAETSCVNQLCNASKKLGPVPFHRRIMENSDQKPWRSVRPKSVDLMHHSSDSCSESEFSSSCTLQNSDIVARYNTLKTADCDNDDSLRQVSEEGRKIRRLHGKSHPLTEPCPGKGPYYSSM